MSISFSFREISSFRVQADYLYKQEKNILKKIFQIECHLGMWREAGDAWGRAGRGRQSELFFYSRERWCAIAIIKFNLLFYLDEPKHCKFKRI